MTAVLKYLKIFYKAWSKKILVSSMPMELEITNNKDKHIIVNVYSNDNKIRMKNSKRLYRVKDITCMMTSPNMT